MRGIKGIIEFRSINHLSHDRTSQYSPLSYSYSHSIVSHTMSHTRRLSYCHRRRYSSRYSQCYHRPCTPASHPSAQYHHTWTLFTHHQCPHGTPRSEDRPWIWDQWILDRARVRGRPRPREYGPLTPDEVSDTYQINNVQRKTHQFEIGGFFISLEKMENTV